MFSGLSALDSYSYSFLILFCRIGAALMFLPGFAATQVPSRIRMLTALSICSLLLPVLGKNVPAQPPQTLELAVLIGGEVTVGIFIGIITQATLSALDVCGNFASYVIGLTSALTFDPITQAQSQIIIGFLNMLALAVIFATDTHHLMLHAIVDSYNVLPAGQWISVDDATQTMVHTITASFSIAMRLAAPLVVFGLVFNAGLGLLGKMVPQIQVFFVAAPLQIILGMTLLLFSLPMILSMLLHHVVDGLSLFAAPR